MQNDEEFEFKRELKDKQEADRAAREWQRGEDARILAEGGWMTGFN